jgi:hypothetical protein
MILAGIEYIDVHGVVALGQIQVRRQSPDRVSIICYATLPVAINPSLDRRLFAGNLVGFV